MWNLNKYKHWDEDRNSDLYYIINWQEDNVIDLICYVNGYTREMALSEKLELSERIEKSGYRGSTITQEKLNSLGKSIVEQKFEQLVAEKETRYEPYNSVFTTKHYEFVNKKKHLTLKETVTHIKDLIHCWWKRKHGSENY